MTDTPNGGGWKPDKHKPGRPMVDPAVKKRWPISIRVTQDMHAAIGAAATASGRSVTQEVEFRLEQSFADARILEALARIEAKLNALDKSPQVVPDPRPPHLRKIMDEDDARMVPHGTDMRPGAITWVEDDGA